MRLRRTFRITAMAALVIAALCVSEDAEAQVEKRVVFKSGKAVFKGKLPRTYADYDAYVLRARKGQTITVKLATSDPDASFSVYETKELGPDEDSIYFGGEERARLWSGKLPITSEYSVQVYGVSSIDDKNPSGAVYTLEVSLR